MIDLWPHQKSAIHSLRQGFAQGHRSQILCAPTGSGKTRVGAFLMNSAADKGGRAAFMVDRVVLARQTSAALSELGISHGVIQSDNSYSRDAKVLVCSSQTIEKRGYFPDDLTLLCVDEAHCQRTVVTEYIRRSGIAAVGLTATPFTKGLGLTYSRVANVTTTDKLIEEGYLAPLNVYAAKPIDMTGAETKGGEWTDAEIEARAGQIMGDVVAEYAKRSMEVFGRYAKAICFTATVDQGIQLCREFAATGFRFAQVSYKTSEAEKTEILAEIAKPDSYYHGVVSCEALSKGFDVKDIEIGMDCKPQRRSFSTHIQKMGRVMRASPGKSFGLWLDFTTNYLRFYDDMVDFFANGCGELDDGQRERKIQEKESKEAVELKCSCGFILKPSMQSCPSCGKERIRKSSTEQVPGELFEVDGKKVKPVKPFLKSKQEAWQGLCRIALDRKKGDPEKSLKFARMQYKNIFGTWPPFPFEPAEHADPRLESHVKHLVIKWAKSQRNKEAA